MPCAILARWLSMCQQRIAMRWIGKEIQIRSVLSEDRLKYLVVTVQDKESAQIHWPHCSSWAENLSFGNSFLPFIFHHPASYLKNRDYKIHKNPLSLPQSSLLHCLAPKTLQDRACSLLYKTCSQWVYFYLMLSNPNTNQTGLQNPAISHLVINTSAPGF